MLEQHAALQPFGMENPEPVFVARGVTLGGEPRVLKEKHLSLVFRQGSAKARAIWFNSAAQELPRPPWDVAFTVERNEYRGRGLPADAREGGAGRRGRAAAHAWRL